MTDPYQVLGVDRSASDDEIKKAYRSLSRRYHPDANVNNPNKAQAEERFKQVQQAYDQVMKERQQGFGGGGYGSAGDGPFGGFYGNYQYGNGSYRSAENEQSPRMQAAANYIRNRKYAEALHVLDDIPDSERSGYWYYYSAAANAGLGNKATAMERIRAAVALEPNNITFRQFQQQLEYGGTWYSDMGRSYERPYSAYGSYCMSLFLMQLLCNCCCRL